MQALGGGGTSEASGIIAGQARASQGVRVACSAVGQTRSPNQIVATGTEHAVGGGVATSAPILAGGTAVVGARLLEQVGASRTGSQAAVRVEDGGGEVTLGAECGCGAHQTEGSTGLALEPSVVGGGRAQLGGAGVVEGAKLGPFRTGEAVGSSRPIALAAVIMAGLAGRVVVLMRGAEGGAGAGLVEVVGGAGQALGGATSPAFGAQGVTGYAQHCGVGVHE